MKYAFLGILVVLLAGVAFAGACGDACKAGYDKDVNDSLAIMQAHGYWTGMMSTNCWSRWNTPSGQPEPCWDAIAKCEGACSSAADYQACKKKCSDEFQTCCHESAVINAQRHLDLCMQACPNETTGCPSSCPIGMTQAPAPSCLCTKIQPCQHVALTDIENGGWIDASYIKPNTKVYVLRKGQATWCEYPGGDQYGRFLLNPGDELRVLGGKALIYTTTGSMYWAEQDSWFSVEDYKEIRAREGGTVTGMFIKMLQGIYVFVVRPNTVGKFEVQTDSATLGVRGTRFLVQKNADETLTAYLVEGQAEAYSANNLDPGKNMSAGQKITFAKDGTPGEPEAYAPGEPEAIWGEPIPGYNATQECVQGSDCPGTQLCMNGQCTEVGVIPEKCFGMLAVLGVAALVLFARREK